MSDQDARARQAQLEAPFDPAEIDFRPADFGNQVVAFIDGEAVIRRLNAVFGPLGWGFDFEALVIAPAQPRKEGGKVLAHDVVWVAKGVLSVLGAMPHSDLGDAEANETSKAAVTDALKRCAVQLGIGLYLRGFPKLTARVENYSVPPDEKARLRRYLLILQLLPGAGLSEAEVCQRLNVESLAALAEAKAIKLIARLQGGDPPGESSETQPASDRPHDNATAPQPSRAPAPVHTPAQSVPGSTARPAGQSDPQAAGDPLQQVKGRVWAQAQDWGWGVPELETVLQAHVVKGGTLGQASRAQMEALEAVMRAKGVAALPSLAGAGAAV